MKKFIIIAIIIIVLGGAGYVEYRSRQSRETRQPAVSEQPVGGITVKESLLSRLKSGEELDCHVVTADVQDYIILAKNGMVRIDGFSDLFATSSAGEGWIYVAKDNWIYVWSDENGVKVNTEVLATALENGNTAAAKYSWEELAKNWQAEKAKWECQAAKLSDNLFVLPENVNFFDIRENL